MELYMLKKHQLYLGVFVVFMLINHSLLIRYINNINYKIKIRDKLFIGFHLIKNYLSIFFLSLFYM